MMRVAIIRPPVPEWCRLVRQYLNGDAGAGLKAKRSLKQWQGSQRTTRTQKGKP